MIFLNAARWRATAAEAGEVRRAIAECFYVGANAPPFAGLSAHLLLGEAFLAGTSFTATDVWCALCLASGLTAVECARRRAPALVLR